MYIDDKLIHSDYNDPHTHLKALLASMDEITKNLYEQNISLEYFELIETVQCINAFCVANGLEEIPLIDPVTTSMKDLDKMINEFRMDLALNSGHIYYKKFKPSKYKFTDEEHTTIQETLNKLRDDVHKSTYFNKEHKQRILDKLEALQKELHKNMGSLDKFLGQLVTIATSVGIAGEKSKPMFDRINETIKAVLRVQDKGDKVPPTNNQIGCEDILEIDSIEDAEVVDEEVRHA